MTAQIIDGKMVAQQVRDYLADGTFRAQQVQAKCASKYQAVPPAPKQAAETSKVASYGLPK